MKKLALSFHNKLKMKNRVWLPSRPYFLLIITLIMSLFLYGLVSFYLDRYIIIQVSDYRTDKIIYNKVLTRQEGFTIQFTHSVSKQPVKELYKITVDNRLALEEMRFNHFSANLPVDSEIAGSETTEFIIDGNSYRVVGFERKMDELLLAVGQVIANHHLIFEDNTEVFLSQKTENSLVIIKAVPLSIGKFLIWRWNEI
ncbi:hypothetical protein GGQ84_001996 [Desulfitispora alkaliphila]|uniref:DUF1850 domain-containing protein n=1 Tax=Desulfitispora alkaliphila TaxID=622674 RepID=UPI003D1A7483